ncbi:MAG: hypothetical protein MZV64_23790 [Ignavibacteriales bacterium]|nr:hypothetical protein [Ignavibacteriales bacterium]
MPQLPVGYTTRPGMTTEAPAPPALHAADSILDLIGETPLLRLERYVTEGLRRASTPSSSS